MFEIQIVLINIIIVLFSFLVFTIFIYKFSFSVVLFIFSLVGDDTDSESVKLRIREENEKQKNQPQPKSIQLKVHKNWKETLYRRIYILTWIRSYDQSTAVSDLIAGITLGLTIIPQAIAYAALASLPSQYGLYAAFMGNTFIEHFNF